jgi:hypothetical protein
MASIWQILQGLAPTVVPVTIASLGVLGKVLYNHERRIRRLEKGRTRHSRSLYGDEQDPQQTGIAQDIRTIDERVASLEADVAEIKDIVEELRDEH